jgi:broad specificity phosphatase PhoE
VKRQGPILVDAEASNRQVKRHDRLVLLLQRNVRQEVDFGSWTGQPFRDLEPNPSWRRWNDARAQGMAPEGERMADVQARIVAHLLDMHERQPRARIVMVSHAEIIRAAVLHVLSMSLDAWRAVDVGPASITAIQVLPHGCDLIGFEEPAAA